MLPQVAIARVNGPPRDLRRHKGPYRPREERYAGITKMLALITLAVNRRRPRVNSGRTKCQRSVYSPVT